MCEPVTIGTLTITAGQMAAIGTAVTVASAAASQYGQYQSAKAQVAAVNQQNELQAEQIAKAAGQEMSERARAARRERGQMRAAGSEMGVSIEGGSFLAALQQSAFNQYNDQGLISYNERNQQKQRHTNATSQMSSIQVPTALSAALAIGSSYVGARQEFKVAGDTASKGVTG